MSRSVMKCPKCRGEFLSLIEIHEEFGKTDPGEILIDGGSLIPPSEFLFSVGDPVLVLIECAECGHEWRPRRQLVAP